MQKKFFAIFAVICFGATFAVSLPASAAGPRLYSGGGATAIREGRNAPSNECISCSGQADYKLGVCYRKYPGKAAGCQRAKNTWLAACFRKCRNNH